MHAVVHRPSVAPAWDFPTVLGQPLIVRQVAWLRAVGCTRILVEVHADPAGFAVARWLGSHAPGSCDVELVTTPRPRGHEQVARRAGLAAGTPYLALPSDVLADADLAQVLRSSRGDGARVLLWSPAGARATSVLIPVVGRAREPAIVAGAGWAATLRSRRDAVALADLALMGRLPLDGPCPVTPVGAVTSSPLPLAWVAPTARVASTAELFGAVYVGPGAFVGPGARVGPSVHVGAGARIEAGARVEEAWVEDGATVGPSATLLHASHGPLGASSLDDGEPATFGDTLLSSQRAPAAPRRAGSLLGRAFAWLEQPVSALGGLETRDDASRLRRA